MNIYFLQICHQINGQIKAGCKNNITQIRRKEGGFDLEVMDLWQKEM
jgi:hypothetical protein